MTASIQGPAHPKLHLLHESIVLRQIRAFGWDDAFMDRSLPKVTIELWRSDAVVLFDWLMSVDLNAVPITHPAEKQALADLLTRLEHETDIPRVTQQQIDTARQEVARDMGWQTPNSRHESVSGSQRSM
jgi:hypothetical protein